MDSRRTRRSRLVFCVLAAFFALSACRIVSASDLLPLRSDAQTSTPEVTVLAADVDGVRLAFELPALEIESFDLNGEAFQTAWFSQAELIGELGQPALPEFTRFVAIPARAGATVRIRATEEQTIPGFRVLPMQEDDGDVFAIDPASYARDEFLGGETATLGTPGLMRELRVVPITFRPVHYNPARGELRVLHRVEVEIDFAGTDLRNAPSRERIAVSRDLDAFYRGTVLNYDRGGRPEIWPTANDLGCWLIIARDDATVRQMIQPLIDWRARMGYKTVLATTTQTGTNPTQIKAWIQNAYNTWDEPPEYILIVGDTSGAFSIGTFYETYSGCNGEGDHTYVQLAGDDLLPDAFIGRLTAEDTGMLDLLVDKILAYEVTPATADPNWFARACVIGDPSYSGITCVQVMQWVKEKLRHIGYTQVDTVFNAPFVSRISNSVNNGVTFVGYRGFYGTSGWDNTNVYNLTNGAEQPFSVMLTCGTGSFAGGTALSEAWFRGVAGAPYTIKGAIGAIGTATTCTHTRFNNCFFAGTAYGLFWEGHYKLGRAQARGKVEMVLDYGAYDPSSAARYIWWNSLMGDPATELWTGRPADIVASYPATVPLGANVVTVTVTQSGLPRPGAWVYLYRSGEIGVGGYTDQAGAVELPLDGATVGTVQVTVTGHNVYPYRGSFAIASQPVFVGIDSYELNDDGSPPSQGNGDGLPSPGETIVPVITLKNFGTMMADDVSLSLATLDPYVGVRDGGPIAYGPIAPGATAAPLGDLVLSLSPLMPPGHVIELDLTATSGASSWPSVLHLAMAGPDLAYAAHALTGCGTQLDPGENAQLSVTLKNYGALTALGPIRLDLASDSYAVRVTDATSSIANSISPGFTGTSSAFGIVSPVDCIPGLLAPLRLAITFADGTRDSAQFMLPVGTADTHAPTGPDAYGYFAYDQTDLAYLQHPGYNWIDINPSSGGPGTDVGLTDNGANQDNTRTIPLPFPFTFYGQTFDRVSVCSNGFLALGSSYVAPSQNWYLPAAQGPEYMIAPFWDDLYQQTTGRVYYWFDANLHRFVIAWDNVRQEATGSTESFEVILYDPAYYPTPTGDGEFVFQYETVYNNDYLQMYSTVGIQNGDHTTGITYNYYNQKPPTAANLAAGLAVKFTTAVPGASDIADGRSTKALRLQPNEPNPFRGATVIRFGLTQDGPVALRVFDLNGQLVRTLYQGRMPAGEHTLPWLGTDQAGRPAPSGVYFYRLDAESQTNTRKLLLLR
jgi:hypothetical protein